MPAPAPVDLRNLPAPEPMLAIINALEAPERPTEGWAFVLPHFPAPVIPMIEQAGCTWSDTPAPDGWGVVLTVLPEPV